MQITKYTHSCIRLERDGAVLVIDPGTWSEPTHSAAPTPSWSPTSTPTTSTSSASRA
jgi:L-ascorbate metabolism protein UlaG (beta-lactamase superfamily)